MAYSTKVNVVAVAVTALMFLAASIAAQPMPEVDKMCAIWIPEIVKHCYATLSTSPSEECCKDLKTASKREVTCLCDNFIANPHPLYANITKVYFTQVNIACGVVDKYMCSGGSANGATSNIVAYSLFVLVVSLFM